MALNLRYSDVERLAAEVAGLTGESKTEAIRRALEEPTPPRRSPATHCSSWATISRAPTSQLHSENRHLAL